METSILIARVLTVIYLSVGFGLLFNPSYYRDALNKLLDNPTYLFLGGWVAASVGVVLVQYHNIWVNDWRLLVTIVAWAALIKGILLLAFPPFIRAFETWFRPKALRNYIMPMVFILGFIFGWFGYFA